jgi:hypothetical protein
MRSSKTLEMFHSVVRKCVKESLAVCVSLICLSALAQNNGILSPASYKNLDITSFGSLRMWSPNTGVLGEDLDINEFNQQARHDSSALGVFWWEARDIQRIEITTEKASSHDCDEALIQYWQFTWPETAPKMPTKEDLEDDPWRGKWITAATNLVQNGNTSVYTFKPLLVAENANASNLPAPVVYRRTLKIRLLFKRCAPIIHSFHVFSESQVKEQSIRIQFNGGDKNSLKKGTLQVFNGRLKALKGWNWNSEDEKQGPESWQIHLGTKPKGIIANILSADETLPGSNDETVVTLRSSGSTFSFSMNDLENGPVYVPAFNTYISLDKDKKIFSLGKTVDGETVRKRITEQPEQSYERARSEIPRLDPTHRDGRGGMEIDIPLANDANWQKFSVQWGGNIVIDKKQTKARGEELKRCNWQGNTLQWNLGTGEEPVYHRSLENCQVSILNNYLPVVQSRWRQNNLLYDEEAFATFLYGPLSPNDPERNEQTPAILMVELAISNPTPHSQTAHVWLHGKEGINNIVNQNGLILDQIGGDQFIRCFIKCSNSKFKDRQIIDTTSNVRIIEREIELKPNSSETLHFYFPFVGDLPARYQSQLASLDYTSERNRVISYWREVVSKYICYNVPERKFNEMAKAVISHIRMSVTKDSRTGLYLVPAATLEYGVYANESIFQTILLDRIGDFRTATDYLKTFTELQGSRSLPGAFVGSQKDVFYGVRIDSLRDLTADGYNMHHGTVLWGLAYHYLHTRDRQWLVKVAPNMRRAANWIIEQRNLTKKKDKLGNKVQSYGLLPAGLLEDATDWQFWYATNAYAYLGLKTMADAFASAGLPQAEFYQKEAASYVTDLRESLKVAIELSPVVRLRNNTFVSYVPSQPYQRFRYFGPRKDSYYQRYNLDIHPNYRRSAIREILYGPLSLLKTGVLDPASDLANSILDDWEDNLTLSSSLNTNIHGWVEDVYWFSRGGMTFQPNLQNPVDIYLIRQEVPAAIRTLYNDFVSCLYADINAQTEEFRQWTHGSGPFYKTPDEARFVSQVVDLLCMEKGNELWLGSGIPQRWLDTGETVELKNGYTCFGRVNYCLRQGSLPFTIEADINLSDVNCSKIILFVHAPFQKLIESVMVNGKPWFRWDAAKEIVILPQNYKTVHIVISYNASK